MKKMESSEHSVTGTKHIVKPLPAAFAAKVQRGIALYKQVSARYKFFFNTITGYDNTHPAWIYSQGEHKLNFCTYSYLGLLKHPHIEKAAQQALKLYGTGTHGARLLGGNLDIHERLEQKIADFFGREAAITFSSGYVTNLTVLDTMVGKGDLILSDELNHASIIDGCRISKAETVRFLHNDLADLEEKLAAAPAEARKLIIVDAVYSMDGDIAPLKGLIALRDKYPNTLLMVDEAHSLGVLGATGHGIEEYFDCPGEIDLLMGTLSKTLPGQGGFIAASQDLVSFLRTNARGFIFSGALSPISTAAVIAGFELLEQEGPSRRNKLIENIHYFIDRLRSEGFEVKPVEAAIIPVMIRNQVLAMEMAQYCHSHGVYVMPVGYPAVPNGMERLRMNLTSHHDKADLDYAVATLVKAREYCQAQLHVKEPALAE